MSDWKRCLLSGVLAAAVGACGSDDHEAGDGAATADDSGIKTGTGVGSVDGGLAGRLDAGAGHVDSGTSPGNGYYEDGDGGELATGEDCTGLQAHIRDFSSVSHPDFEKFSGSGTKGLVQSTLGADGKPVFASTGTPVQITSAATFAQWYNDTPGVNVNIPYMIPLTEMSDGSFQFSSKAFFPIDSQTSVPPPLPEPLLMAEDGKLHNFSFTTEVHASFTYHGKENFMFTGDDDLWIFVNNKLALDLGGLHSSLSGNIDFDAKAQELGLKIGGKYQMDIFHAERHTTASNFAVRTTIECFTPPERVQ
jgi:fibro-slime domain-containing protein